VHLVRELEQIALAGEQGIDLAGRMPHRSLNVFATTSGFEYAVVNRRRPPGPQCEEASFLPPGGRTPRICSPFRFVKSG